MAAGRLVARSEPHGIPSTDLAYGGYRLLTVGFALLTFASGTGRLRRPNRDIRVLPSHSASFPLATHQASWRHATALGDDPLYDWALGITLMYHLAIIFAERRRHDDMTTDADAQAAFLLTNSKATSPFSPSVRRTRGTKV